MGFFDSLKKIFDTVEEISKTASASDNKAAAAPKTAPAAKPANKTPGNILNSGDIPAKPSVQRKTSFFGGETGDDKFDVTFMLSGDFIEFNSHCELDPAFQYEPDNNEDYTEYKQHYSCIFFGEPDEIYDAVEEYREKGTVGRDFRKIENGTYLFAATVDYCGDNLRIYAFSGNTAKGEHSAVALQYCKDLEGTALEKKLIAALDEAAETYSEVLSK